jgi:hypothetical protein
MVKHSRKLRYFRFQMWNNKRLYSIVAARWIVDAYPDDRHRYVVESDELLSAFLN